MTTFMAFMILILAGGAAVTAALPPVWGIVQSLIVYVRFLLSGPLNRKK